jgi:hypothetical protein
VLLFALLERKTKHLSNRSTALPKAKCEQDKS